MPATVIRHTDNREVVLPVQSVERAWLLAANALLMAFHDALPTIGRMDPGWFEVQRGFDILADGKRTLQDRVQIALPLWSLVRQKALAVIPTLVSVEVRAD